MAQPTLFPESGFRRLRLDIAYDGTNFYGWAAQPERRTIQDLIEEALSRIARVDVESIVAGRTDAGVHATGQVVHVDVPDAIFDGELTYKIFVTNSIGYLMKMCASWKSPMRQRDFMPVFQRCAGITPTRFSTITM